MKRISFPGVIVIWIIVNLFSGAYAEVILERSLKFGGVFTLGNTQIQSLNFSFYLNKNRRWIDEVTAKGSFYDEMAGGIKSMLKASAVLRYAFTFSEKYYNFYRIEFEHDRFKNLNLRIIPTVGVGYWWSDQEEFQLMAEGALGYQKEHLQDRSETGKTILQSRGYLYRKLFENVVLSEDLYLYSQLEHFDNYRMVSESNLALNLNKNWALNFGLLSEYNSQPPSGVGASDLRFTTTLKYSSMLELP